MDINQKNVLNMLSSMGGLNSSQKAQAENLIAGYKNKNEQQLVGEIMQLKQTLKKDPVKFQKQVSAVKSLRGMTHGAQRQRLDMLINLLERD